MSDSQVTQESIEKLSRAYVEIKQQMSKVIVGQEQVIDHLLISMFSRGHCLLEGVPGLAKTLMISTLAQCLSMRFHRIQFTPDLMPADITGTDVIQENKQTGHRESASRSLCWRLKTRSSKRAHTRCRKLSKTASCSRSSSITRALRKNV